MTILINTLVGLVFNCSCISAHTVYRPQTTIGTYSQITASVQAAKQQDEAELIKQYRSKARQEVQKEVFARPAAKIRRVNKLLRDITNGILWFTFAYFVTFKVLAYIL